MTDWESTREQRAERLRGLVEGSSASRRARQTGPGNLLFGVALHAAARANDGLELSDFEQLLTDALNRLLPADEIAEAAATFTRAQARAGASVFPSSVARLAVDASYTGGDLKTDLRELGMRVIEQPNCSIVRVADLAAGGQVDSPEFIAAMQEYGSGLTVIRDTRSQTTPTASPMKVNVRLSGFYCEQSTGDSHFGRSDEIYWMVASGSDSGDRTTYASPEFGNIDKGSERWFPGEAHLFSGSLTQMLTTDIECWEKDQGSFWDAVRNALADVAGYCVDAATGMADEPVNNPDEDCAAWAALIAVVSGLLTALLDWLMGSDDLIQHRTLAFDRAYIDQLAVRGEKLAFVGEGAEYLLYIHVTGPKKLDPYWAGLRGTAFASGFTAATAVPGSSSDAYLFKGSQYIRYNVNDHEIRNGPSTISSGWPGLQNASFASDLSAAVVVPGSGSDVYLFKGSQYIRYDVHDDKIRNGPSTISSGWRGLQNTAFTSDITAALVVPGSGSDVYLFKGNQCMRYNANTETIVWGPDTIVNQWPGLGGTGFAAGNLSSSCNVPSSNQDVFLFKGDEYVRYNVPAETIID